MKVKAEHKTNWTVMILLILGLITIAFPLYMTIVIAFKQPSEMTNSISGILSLPESFSDEGNGLLEFPEKQFADFRADCGTFHCDPFPDGIRGGKK